MLAFLIIFLSGLCGYLQSPLSAPVIATLGLVSVSLAHHHVTIRTALARGRAQIAMQTLAKSVSHAAIACGGCFLTGAALRLLSGL